MSEDSEDFWDKVGEDTDPVRFFAKKIEECGGTVSVDDEGYLEIKDGCRNLHYHNSGKFKEVFCEKCGVSISIDDITTLDNKDIELEEDETPKKNEEASVSSDDDDDDDGLDEFLNIVG